MLWYEIVGDPVKDFLLRFLLNYFLFSAIVFGLRRFFLGTTMILSVLLQFSFLYYFLHFKTPPLFSNLLFNVEEGAEVGDAIFALFPWPWFGLYLIFGAVVCFLVFLRDRHGYIGQRRLVYSLAFSFAFVVLFCGLNTGKRSLQTKRVGHGSEEVISKFGITPVLLRDALQIHSQKSSGLFAAALDKEKERSYLLETEYYPTTQPKNIVVVQVESLDYTSLNFVKNGRVVTPFLNSLLETSLHYRARADVAYGSATADFVLLNGIPPAPGLFNYNISDFPYNTSLPAFLKERGYKTFSVHGVRGGFYNRKAAFGKMKFDRAAFHAEILDELKKRDSTFRARFSAEKIAWYQKQSWLLDELIFDYAHWIMEENSHENNFVFLITASSHTPFTAPVPEVIVPDAQRIQDRYLNTIHYLDHELGEFYESLPDGTLVVIYSDHAAYLDTEDYRSDIVGKIHFIPLILSVKGENIAPYQTVVAGAPEIDLSLRDAHSFIRKYVGSTRDIKPNEMTASGDASTIR